MFVVWFVVALYSWAWPDVSLSGGDKINKGEKGVVPSILISSTPFFSMTFAASFLSQAAQDLVYHGCQRRNEGSRLCCRVEGCFQELWESGCAQGPRHERALWINVS